MRGQNSSWLFLGLVIAALIFWSLLLNQTVSGAQEKHLSLSELSSEEWMDRWMGGTKTPVGALHLRRFKDPMYIITREFGWTPNPGQEEFLPVTVPKGFVTDFASIPPIFFSLLRPDGEYTYPAIIHDYLYWTQSVPRDQADQIFQRAMEDFQVNSMVAFVIYRAVRWGGQFAWDANAREKARGEKRILKRFPQNPLTTWEEWKNRPNVFAP